jgi:hypothetical protein
LIFARLCLKCMLTLMKTPMKRIPYISALVLCLLVSLLPAAEVTLSARADKTQLELGESFIYRLDFGLKGQSQFQPQLQNPEFDKLGFKIVGGPQQSQGYQWVNGVVTQSVSLVWELAPLKAGKITIPPAKVILKDPSGERQAVSAAVQIMVKRGRAFVLPPTPTAGPTQEPAPGLPPEDTELRPLKGDLGFAWMRLGLIVGVFALVAGLLLWWALRPPKAKVVAVPRDPGQDALHGLERARPLLEQGETEAYFKAVDLVLRTYFIHRLRVAKTEPTLFELRNAYKARRKLERKTEEGGLMDAVVEHLALALYAKEKPSDRENAAFPENARALVLELERR